ncbi:hypothetical protein V9L05_24060 (plasmid) [Bernardetia sp. Wsw4-3y2]|uniref:hypothetical protein n=1 Tax=unclassified Bernardetia TaxID=2647129 RepID=UPI0030D419D2
MSEASAAQEFNKVRNEWRTIDKKQWEMAIWISEYQDLDILDKFMDTEASPIGIFDDIFFRFNTFFENPEQYEQGLWNEFLAWFETPNEKKYDIIGALKEDGFLPQDYKVDSDLPPIFISVLKELKRLKNTLKLEDINFILYFPPAKMHQKNWAKWFESKLGSGKIPKDIRFAAIDLRQERVLKDVQSTYGKQRVRELYVDLDMLAAMNNEMDKDSEAGKPNSPVGKFQKQVRKVMEATANNKIDLDKETTRLKTLGYRLNLLNTKSSAHLICAIAFSSKQKTEKSFQEVNAAIKLTERGMMENVEGAYPVWRAAMLLKAALYMTDKDNEQAIFCYRKLTEKSKEQKDVFYTMEGFRQSAFLFAQMKRWKEAWTDCMLSLEAGSLLEQEMRRSSTYLFSAELALEIAKQSKRPLSDIQILHDAFTTLIGEDWQNLLEGKEALTQDYLQQEVEQNVENALSKQNV